MRTSTGSPSATPEVSSPLAAPVCGTTANTARREDVVAVFIESFAPPPQMLIFGAVDFTAALAKVAKVLGYRVTVCDAREVFATNQRFPMADDLVVDWPDRLLADIGGDLGRATPSASSPTTPSSMSPPSPHRWRRRSATSA